MNTLAERIAERIVRAYTPQLAPDAVGAIARIVQQELQKHEQEQIEYPFPEYDTELDSHGDAS